MRILFIQNCGVEGPGSFAESLRERGVDLDVRHVYRDERLPAPADVDAVLVGGTPLAAYEVHKHPFLRREWLFLESIIEAGKPCLGICFGAQLLARLLRARAFPAPGKEIGAGRVRLTEHGLRDPLFEGFPPEFPVFQWHGDTSDVPEHGLHLASSERCRNQAFRLRNTAGLQFHLETTPQAAARWAEAYAAELEAVRLAAAEVVAQCEAGVAETRPLADRLMANFLGMCG